MGKLDGKVAIVTGAARGLGRAYAKRLAGLGAKIAVADLDLKSYREFDAEAQDMTAESTVAEIAASGGAAFGIEVDVRDHQAVEAMAARVVEQWGRVDVLVANAGGGRGRPVDTKASTIDPALLDLVVGMNFFGTVYCCNAVAPVMKRQRSGKIVTVSSVAGLSPSADGGYAHYGAAKAAIAHYTRYLAPLPPTASPPASSPPGGSCRSSSRAAATAIETGRSRWHCGASARSRTAPKSSSFSPRIYPIMFRGR